MRFVIWAIPIMGFLGTVIGITVAIASLSPTQLENISGVVAGLGTAFDTTATALALSMVLMFVQFAIDRTEQKLLAEVDERAWTALAGRSRRWPACAWRSRRGRTRCCSARWTCRPRSRPRRRPAAAPRSIRADRARRASDVCMQEIAPRVAARANRAPPV